MTERDIVLDVFERICKKNLKQNALSLKTNSSMDYATACGTSHYQVARAMFARPTYKTFQRVRAHLLAAPRTRVRHSQDELWFWVPRAGATR